MVELSAQRVDLQDLGLQLQVRHPGRLRWRLPRGDSGREDEVFELVACASSADLTEQARSTRGEESLQPSKSLIPCTFVWIAPRTRFLLAPHLSKLVCRTRDLAAALHTLVMDVELVRLAEDLAEREEGWSTFSLNSTGLSVEYRAMLGVSLQLSGPGVLKCCCLSQKRLKGGRPSKGVVPNFDMFMKLLMSGSIKGQQGLGDGNTVVGGWNLTYIPGSLDSRLKPLWAYLRTYCVLLQLYMLMKTQHGILLADGCFEMRVKDVHAPGHLISWVVLKWARPALGMVCNIELLTDSRKRARLDENARQLDVRLRFTWQQTSGSDSSKTPSSCFVERNRLQQVLQRFQVFFDDILAGSGAFPRVTRLLMPLVLLGAPHLWILEEALLLLPPLQVAPERGREAELDASTWVSVPEHLTLVPPSGGGAPAPQWQLRFVLAPRGCGLLGATDGSLATCSVTCLLNTGDGIKDELSSTNSDESLFGWNEILIDGTPIAVWAKPGSRLEVALPNFTTFLDAWFFFARGGSRPASRYHVLPLAAICMHSASYTYD